MGQQGSKAGSKEEERLLEVTDLIDQITKLTSRLRIQMAHDAARAAAAGVPAAPSSDKALYDAAGVYYNQLLREKIALFQRRGE